jgi:HSP20 family protein
MTTSLSPRDPFRSIFSFPRFIDEFDTQIQRGLKIRETEHDIIVEAVVAGVPTDSVDVDIEDGVLTIKAEHKTDEKGQEGRLSSSYSYYYTTALSGGQWDKAEAEVEHGVVTIKIPKAESVKPRKITVKAKK